jgi:hypothetical protein
MDEPILADERHPAKYWHKLDDGRLQCDICPRDCKLHEGHAVPVLCGAWRMVKWCLPAMVAHPASVSIPFRKSCSTIFSPVLVFSPLARLAVTWSASSARIGISQNRATWIA